MDTTIKTIEATPTPLAIVVDKRNQISKIAVNKIVRDIVSKSEIILQEVTVPGLVDSIFTKTRKNRRNPYRGLFLLRAAPFYPECLRLFRAPR